LTEIPTVSFLMVHGCNTHIRQAPAADVPPSQTNHRFFVDT